jgi:hypothetical protein
MGVNLKASDLAAMSIVSTSLEDPVCNPLVSFSPCSELLPEAIVAY